MTTPTNTPTKTKLSIDARIEAARKKLQDLIRAKRKKEFASSAAARKLENRRKIIAGAWFINHATEQQKKAMVDSLSEREKLVFS